MSLSRQRKSIYPHGEDTWESIAQREMPDAPLEEAISMLQSWNLHVFMRPAAPEGSPRQGNLTESIIVHANEVFGLT